MDKADQSPIWIVEVKWSDRPYRVHSELDRCIEFVNRHPKLIQLVLVTSRTITEDELVDQGVKFHFKPASLYAYELSANLLQQI